MESIRASHKNTGFAIHIQGYILIVLNFQHPQQEHLQQLQPRPQPQQRPQPHPQQRLHSLRSVFFIFISIQTFLFLSNNLFLKHVFPTFSVRSSLTHFWFILTIKKFRESRGSMFFKYNLNAFSLLVPLPFLNLNERKSLLRFRKCKSVFKSVLKSRFFLKPFWAEMKVLQVKNGYYFRILHEILSDNMVSIYFFGPPFSQHGWFERYPKLKLTNFG